MSDWKKDFSHSLKSFKEIQSFFADSPEHYNKLSQHFDDNQYSVFLPISFAQKIKDLPVNSPLWKQFIPHHDEFIQGGMLDPIGDQNHQKTKQLVHRYKNRALFIPTTVCPIHCRYCFRKNELTSNDVFSQDLEHTLNYLLDHSEIEEIIFTGGDPLILSDKKIEGLLHALSQIEHIQFIRFHSRTPVILPSRLTDELKNVFDQFKTRFHITMSLHINHAQEWSQELETRLVEFRSFNLLSQTVLLKGVNDNANDLVDLFKLLARNSVKPYYLHHPDQAQGTEHFQIDLQHGRKIYAKLRDQLSGWMIPEYILDIPGGYGKNLAYNSENIEFSGYLLDKNSLKRPVTKRTTL